MARNVAEDVALPKQGKRKAIYLATKELELFIVAAGKSRHFAAIMTEIGTGLRRGELLGLKWDCIDLEAGTITVRRQLVRTRKGAVLKEKPKTEAGYRTIDLPDEVVAILKRHKAVQAQERLICGQAYENNGLVFAQAIGRRIEPRNFTVQVDKMMERAGIRHVPFHSLRHSHATELLRMGVDLAVISDRLGHSSYQVTREFYAHIAPELKRDAADKINSLLTPGKWGQTLPAGHQK